jgi:DNA mismatch repair protein MutL
MRMPGGSDRYGRIERPSSVVKELVENALDAGSTAIRIEVRDAGSRMIRVVDDGIGMDREDIPVALERHSTSKIRSFEDLERVTTLGFRGEALPSIAAVSRMEILSRQNDRDAATTMDIRGGEIVGIGESTRSARTTITVRDLFYNTPVRRKFLKTRGTELRKIIQVVFESALSNLSVAYRLESDGRVLLECERTDDLFERVGYLFTGDLARQLIPLHHREDECEIFGLVSRPEEIRPGSAKEFVFVNGRPVRSPLVRKSLRRGYRATLKAGLKPSFFLFLNLPPSLVDVNIHPTKTEVKFRGDEAIAKLVETSTIGALASTGSIPDFDRARRLSVLRDDGDLPYGTGGRGGIPPSEVGDQMSFLFSGAGEPDLRTSEIAEASPIEEEVYYPSMVQVHNTFILVQTRRGILIIDQHASHERILYEKLIDSFAGGTLTFQKLLFPLTFHLNPFQHSTVMEHLELFRTFGFEIEPFGGRSVILHSAPCLHPRFEVEIAFREMVDELSEHANPEMKQHERLAKVIACKSAVKAGQSLSKPEMCELFDTLFSTRVPSRDVHGRPTMVQIGIDELRKRFERG